MHGRSSCNLQPTSTVKHWHTNGTFKAIQRPDVAERFVDENMTTLFQDFYTVISLYDAVQINNCVLNYIATHTFSLFFLLLLPVINISVGEIKRAVDVLRM